MSLLLFFGFKKVSANKNKEVSTNIEQLNILKYIPENYKLLFISNLDSFNIVSELEGIIPALETSHAFAWLEKLCPTLEKDTHIVINCSGRGDKDVNTVASSLDI